MKKWVWLIIAALGLPLWADESVPGCVQIVNNEYQSCEAASEKQWFQITPATDDRQSEVFVIKGVENKSIYSSDLNLSIVDIRDYNADGGDDVMLSIDSGGNCCAPSFAILLSPFDGAPIEEMNMSSWSSPLFRNGENGTEIIFPKNTEDMTDAIYQITGNEIAVVQEPEALPKVPAVKELLATAYSEDGVDTDETISMSYDLDNDGIDDEVLCNNWDRWSSLTCEIQASHDERLSLHIGCERIGILEERDELGYSKMICDANRIMKVDPESLEYVFEESVDEKVVN